MVSPHGRTPLGVLGRELTQEKREEPTMRDGTRAPVSIHSFIISSQTPLEATGGSRSMAAWKLAAVSRGGETSRGRKEEVRCEAPSPCECPTLGATIIGDDRNPNINVSFRIPDQ